MLINSRARLAVKDVETRSDGISVAHSAIWRPSIVAINQMQCAAAYDEDNPLMEDAAQLSALLLVACGSFGAECAQGRPDSHSVSVWRASGRSFRSSGRSCLVRRSSQWFRAPGESDDVLTKAERQIFAGHSASTCVVARQLHTSAPTYLLRTLRMPSSVMRAGPRMARHRLGGTRALSQIV